MAKRLFDIFCSFFGLLVLSPVLLVFMFLIWREDKASPFYLAKRVGKGGVPFTFVKFRSMRVGADKTGVSSTSDSDSRITPIGAFVRRYKLDELPQLWNVLLGQVSLVGPRPNIVEEVALYTEVERGLVSVRPGITDISSIVFADEGSILKDSKDPNADYDRIIRPWKSRLGLFYIEKQSVLLDVQLILLTILAIVSRPKALKRVSSLLESLGADADLVKLALRDQAIPIIPPPGSQARPAA